MKIFLLIYLITGFLLTFIGPIAKKIKSSFEKIKLDNEQASLEIEEESNQKWRIIAFASFMRLLNILFYPASIIIISIDYFSDKRRKSALVNNVPGNRPKGLYYNGL